MRYFILAIMLIGSAPAIAQSVGCRACVVGSSYTPREAALFKCLQEQPTDTSRGAPFKNEEWLLRCVAGAPK